MVWAFFAGVCIGLPAGCILREQGYKQKLILAYAMLNPNKERKSTHYRIIINANFVN